MKTLTSKEIKSNVAKYFECSNSCIRVKSNKKLGTITFALPSDGTGVDFILSKTGICETHKEFCLQIGKISEKLSEIFGATVFPEGTNFTIITNQKLAKKSYDLNWVMEIYNILI